MVTKHNEFMKFGEILELIVEMVRIYVVLSLEHNVKKDNRVFLSNLFCETKTKKLAIKMI